MNVKTALAALAIGFTAAVAVPQSAQAAGYVAGSYYGGYYPPRHVPRFCYDAYGYRYYCDPYDYDYYYGPSYYGPSVSIGFGYRDGYGWDHRHNSSWHGHGGHDSHHWHH